MYSYELRSFFYDWNNVSEEPYLIKIPQYPIEIHDETLRDGLQSPSVNQPKIDEMIKYLDFVEQLSIDSLTIGFPCVSDKHYQQALAIAGIVADKKMPFNVGMTARTVISDIDQIISIRDKSNIDIEAQLFLGCSKIRQFVESWSIDQLVDWCYQSICYAKNHGLRVIFITEDTTRTHPDIIEKLYLTAAALNVERINVCDTVGYATPCGVYSCIKFIRELLDRHGHSKIKIDFHGHMDRGLALWNSIVALSAGANRIQVCGLGIGERTGNTSLEQLLVNLKLMQWRPTDLTLLSEYSKYVAKIFDVSIPSNSPVIGKDAYLTATGVHAAAIAKAKYENRTQISEFVYSAIPANWVGRENEIAIGPMSGSSNVEYWLNKNGYSLDSGLISLILQTAKCSDRLLSDNEITNICKDYRRRN